MVREFLMQVVVSVSRFPVEAVSECAIVIPKDLDI